MDSDEHHSASGHVDNRLRRIGIRHVNPVNITEPYKKLSSLIELVYKDHTHTYNIFTDHHKKHYLLFNVNDEYYLSLNYTMQS